MPIEKMGVPIRKDATREEISRGVEENRSTKFEKYEKLIRDSFLRGSLVDVDAHITEANKEKGSIVLPYLTFKEKDPYTVTLTIDTNGHAMTKFSRDKTNWSETDIARDKFDAKNGPEFDLSEEEIQAIIEGTKKSIEHNLKNNPPYNSGEEHYKSLMKILNRMASNISKRE